MKTAAELKQTIQEHAMLAADYRSANVPEAEKLNPLVWESIEALNRDIEEIYRTISQLQQDVAHAEASPKCQCRTP